MMEKSEFGKGLIICLVKFAEHAMEFQHQLELYKKMREKSPDLFKESGAITTWANGASDHLYEIEVPKETEWNEIRLKVNDLRDKGLDMGHGTGLTGGKEFKKEEVGHLIDLTREIAILIDKKLGLKPELGGW